MRIFLSAAACGVMMAFPGQAFAETSPCGLRIERIEQSMPPSQEVLERRESTSAKLHHQPTQQTVERATEKARAEAAALVTRARQFDAEGNAAECMKLAATLEVMLETKP